MIKEYLEIEYKKAILDFKCSRTEDDQWNARKELAKLERLASEKYGFEYADELHRMLDCEK